MALRTVGVKLQADVRDYSASISKASKDTKTLGDKLTEAAKAGDKTAAASADAARKVATLAEQMKASGKAGVSAFRLSEQAAAKLDDQIEETARSIQDLEREFAKTGDFKLVSSLNRQMGLLKRQLKARDMFNPAEAAKAGSEMAGEVAVSFGARLGPLIARTAPAAMNPAVLAAAAPFAIGAASVVGGAMAGAVVGGAGIGGVVGGLVLASKDARVRTAGAALGKDFGAMMGRASAVFVPTTLDAIDLIRARMLGLEPQLRRVFAGAARLVEPLIHGAFSGIEQAMPGIVRAIEQAGPVIDAIADGLRRIGRAVGNVLGDLSDNADEGARALELMFRVIEGGILLIGKLVEGAAWLFGFLDKYGGLVWDVATKTDKADGSTKGLADRLRDLGTQSQTTAEHLEALRTAFDELFGVQMDADEALIAYHQGLKDLNAELTKGKRTLSVHSQEGRDNRSAVLDQIEAIKRLRDSRIAEGMSITDADRKYQAHLGSLRKTLLAAGYTKSEVDKLIGSYLRIPSKVATKVSVDTVQAAANLAHIKKLSDKIKSKKVTITVRRNEVVTRSEGRNVPIGDGIGGRRWGGIDYAMARGGAIEAHHVTSPTILYGERATGGEAFIPKNGDDRRSRAIWEYVGENWLGARPAQPGVAMAGGGRVAVDITLRWPDGAVAGRIVSDGFSGVSGRDAVSGLLRGIRNAGGDPSALKV